jgi:hypothetical protein
LNRAEFSFVAANGSDAFAASLSSVIFTVPATTTANPSTFGQSVTAAGEVRGGIGSPNGSLTFNVGPAAGTVGLTPQESATLVVQSAGGPSLSCFLTGAGGAKCVASNFSGILGKGNTTDSTTPGDVTGLTSGVVKIVSSSIHGCALTAAYGVKCWGFNGNGRLGDGSTTSSSTPVDVTDLTTGVTAISAGATSTCALTTTVVEAMGRYSASRV